MSASMPRVSLLTYLLALTVCAVVPLVCFAVYLTVGLTGTEQAAVERGLVETANALVSGVERELMSTATTLEALATSAALDRPDLEAFRSRSLRVLASQKRHGWLTIHLAASDGTPLMNALYARGAGLPKPDAVSVRETVVAGRPTVSNLVAIPEGTHVYAVRVPVVRDGTVKYVLTAAVSAEAQREALLSQSGVADRIAVLFDRQNTIVYRTVNAATLIGTPVTPRLAREADARSAGAIDDVNREGTPVRTVFQRSAMSGWTVAVGVPHAVLYAAQHRTLREISTVGVIFLGSSAAMAIVFARSIRRAVAALVTGAERLGGANDRPVASETSITELRRLGAALTEAARLIRERDASLQHQLEELRLARQAAEGANRAKDEFLAVLSHELRTPLNAVYGWARMLRGGHVTGEATHRALDAIIRNADAQVQLIDDLLDISRVIAGKVRLDVQAIDLKSVVEHAIDAVQPAADAKQIRLQPLLDPRAGRITGDPARLQQVVWNLLINAVKFTDRGGRVQVHLLRASSHVEVVVSDTGRGISSELLPLIFDRFRQADSSSSRPVGGLGLGLALVKHLVELHGGTVLAQSAGEGKGATFVVRLPVAVADLHDGPLPRTHPSPPALERATTGVRLDGLRVLVVDDDRDALDLATAILATAGATVRTSRAAREGLALVQQWRPDVLVSDIEMPEEDGYTFIRKVRALDADHGGRTPAVALTAYGRTQDRTLSLTAGYNMHVPKPVDPGELTAIVANVAGHTMH
jgi:signal transduction histidine kinase/ActR/RegA family two-component response regulator